MILQLNNSSSYLLSVHSIWHWKSNRKKTALSTPSLLEVGTRIDGRLAGWSKWPAWEFMGPAPRRGSSTDPRVRIVFKISYQCQWCFRLFSSVWRCLRVWDIYFWNESLNLQKRKNTFFRPSGLKFVFFFLQLDDGSMCLIETFESWPVDGLRPRWLSELQAAADMTKVAWSGTQQGPVIDSWLTQALKGKPTIDYRFYRCVIRNQEIQ